MSMAENQDDDYMNTKYSGSNWEKHKVLPSCTMLTYIDMFALRKCTVLHFIVNSSVCFLYLIKIIVKNNYDSDDSSKGSPNIYQFLEVLQNEFSIL